MDLLLRKNVDLLVYYLNCLPPPPPPHTHTAFWEHTFFVFRSISFYFVPQEAIQSISRMSHMRPYFNNVLSYRHPFIIFSCWKEKLNQLLKYPTPIPWPESGVPEPGSFLSPLIQLVKHHVRWYMLYMGESQGHGSNNYLWCVSGACWGRHPLGIHATDEISFSIYETHFDS